MQEFIKHIVASADPTVPIKELTLAYNRLLQEIGEREKRTAELMIANTALAQRNQENEKMSAELTLANSELAYQNEDKSRLATQLALANRELAHQNTEKEKHAMELAAAVTDLREKREEVRVLNEDLEKKVAKRTEELELANRELETFSYSVSHDLRAPINAVMGFTGIIQQEYGDRMEPEIRELFVFIQQSGRRMSIIIDDLLRLAKCSKEERRSEAVDMNTLIRSAWDQLCILHPNKATLKLAELPTIHADRSMMEQVAINLLSNAIKYSAKKAKPIISIWSEIKDSHTVFFFKDNGVGFDMSNYGRLFGAFQRLHGMSEFEGIGVGLTLVKRIIEKHGGTVGAESKVGEGATFYISLPA